MHTKTRADTEVIPTILQRAKRTADQLISGSTQQTAQVDSFSLFLQLALHLPKFEIEALDGAVIRSEAERLLHRLVTARSGTAHQIPRLTNRRNLATSLFSPISSDVARSITERYHYLMSFRTDSIHFGLTFEQNKWPSVLVSLSSFDLDNVADETVEWTKEVLVVSRVYAFPGVPKNSISFTLAKLRKWLLANRPEIKALLTYCNTNLGFTGASYEADNWRLLGYESCTRYTYLNGNYVTDRRIAELFGKAPDELPRTIGNCVISSSVWPLEPLRIFVRSLGRTVDLGDDEPQLFGRWKARAQLGANAQPLQSRQASILSGSPSQERKRWGAGPEL